MDNVEFKKFVKQGCDSLLRVKAEKDFRKTLAEDVKDKFNMKAAEFNKHVNAAFDVHEAEKKIQELQDAVDKAKSLGF